MALSITLLIEYHYAERRYKECRNSCIVMLSVIMLGVLMLNVVAPFFLQIFLQKWSQFFKAL